MSGVARRVVSAAVVATTAMTALAMSSGVAAADPCPDIEVVYARGTGSPPGVGWIGQAFIDSLRPKVGDRSVGVYAVNYPATMEFRESIGAGVRDARARVEYMAANCPDTRLVLGGTSQGAGVITLITASMAPTRGFVTEPISPELGRHVAAVVVFGNPSRGRGLAGQPLPAISPEFGDRTIDMCAGGDPVCANGADVFAHFSYVNNGMVEEAARYVAGKL
ncbi:cutinase family protein [Mycolicibacterium austroafricanum]|uniref:cutinase family protein n=1 Tax=Mycolicibacterium austroafricanum TaxID=39687 RepID=UPI000CFA6007|nr:cutinase family protein [Mycolicibacterium austroafricanum]PQP41718.1 cutinase family protein [Mycolicibacterium austroafricanum]